MPREKDQHPTKLELALLKLLWDESPLTARQIRERLSESGRALAHTSVITTLQKMVSKQQIEQLSPVEGKAYRFAPRIGREDVSASLLGDLVDRVFDGSAEMLMQRLFEVSDLDEEALLRIRKTFNKKLRERRT